MVACHTCVRVTLPTSPLRTNSTQLLPCGVNQCPPHGCPNSDAEMPDCFAAAHAHANMRMHMLATLCCLDNMAARPASRCTALHSSSCSSSCGASHQSRLAGSDGHAPLGSVTLLSPARIERLQQHLAHLACRACRQGHTGRLCVGGGRKRACMTLATGTATTQEPPAPEWNRTARTPSKYVGNSVTGCVRHRRRHSTHSKPAGLYHHQTNQQWTHQGFGR